MSKVKVSENEVLQPSKGWLLYEAPSVIVIDKSVIDLMAQRGQKIEQEKQRLVDLILDVDHDLNVQTIQTIQTNKDTQ